MTITGGTALSREDVDRMVADAEKFAEEDRKRREAAEVRNDADQVVYQVDKFLQESGDKVPEPDREELKRTSEELKETLKGEDVDKIRSATDAAMQVFQRVGQAMHQSQQAQQAQQAGGQATAGGGDEQGASGGEDVVEGEIVDEGGAS